MSTDIKFSVDKLVGQDNWSEWKIDAELLLRYHGVSEVVSGLKVKPEPLSDDVLDAPENLAHQQSVQAFDKEDTTAMLILRNAMDSHHKRLTSSCESAMGIWQKMLSIYEQSSGHQRLDRLLEDLLPAPRTIPWTSPTM